VTRDELEAEMWHLLARYKGAAARSPSSRLDTKFVDAILAAAGRYAVAECGVTAVRRDAADAEMAAHPGRGRDLWKRRVTS
jgi:hypothetical protein